MTDTSPERVAEVVGKLRNPGFSSEWHGVSRTRVTLVHCADAADLLSGLAAERDALADRHAKALHLAEYIDHKMRGLDDFGDLAAIPTQPWLELFDLLRGAALNETGDASNE